MTGTQAWQGLETSDGSAVATVPSGQIVYTYGIGGATWKATSSISGAWRTIACDANCTRMVVAGASYIWTSQDAGLTWTSRTSAAVRQWYSLASSSNGMVILAAADGNFLYVSLDGGSTWSARVK